MQTASMETPSSTRRVTRSQTLAASANSSNILLSKKVEESEKTTTKSRQKSAKKQQQDRSALIDITNDSPIVGLAMGNLKTTPSSAMSKKRMNNQGPFARTPGSGEALLRGQVKTLLQKVEEEAEISKITLENRPFFNLQGLVKSPTYLVAPTPANTPQDLNLSANSGGLPSVTPSPVTEKFLIPQMFTEVAHEKKQESIESENLITRSLLLDFSEKLENSDSSECSSVLTYQGVICGDAESSRNKLTEDDDDASIWSIQANASSTRDDDDEEVGGCLEEDGDNDHCYYEEEGDEEHDTGDNDGLLDELCKGISNICVKEEGTKFTGKHIRFVYNSDDEIQEEEVSVRKSPYCEALRLKRLPTRKGKHLHLRFPQESEDN